MTDSRVFTLIRKELPSPLKSLFVNIKTTTKDKEDIIFDRLYTLESSKTFNVNRFGSKYLSDNTFGDFIDSVNAFLVQIKETSKDLNKTLLIFYHVISDTAFQIREMVKMVKLDDKKDIDGPVATNYLESKYVDIDFKIVKIEQVDNVAWIEVKFEPIKYEYIGENITREIKTQSGIDFYRQEENIASGDLFVKNKKNNEFVRFWNPYIKSTIYRWLYDNPDLDIFENQVLKLYPLPSVSIESFDLVFVPDSKDSTKNQVKSILDIKNLPEDVLSKKVLFGTSEILISDLKKAIEEADYPEMFIPILSPTLGKDFPEAQFTIVTKDNVQGFNFKLDDGEAKKFTKEFSLGERFYGKYGILADSVLDAFRFGFTIIPKPIETIEIDPQPKKDDIQQNKDDSQPDKDLELEKRTDKLQEKQVGLYGSLETLLRQIKQDNQKQEIIIEKLIEKLRETTIVEQVEEQDEPVQIKPMKPMTSKSKILPSFLTQRISF